MRTPESKRRRICALRVALSLSFGRVHRKVSVTRSPPSKVLAVNCSLLRGKCSRDLSLLPSIEEMIRMNESRVSLAGRVPADRLVSISPFTEARRPSKVDTSSSTGEAALRYSWILRK